MLRRGSILVILGAIFAVSGATAADENKMAWFEHDKFGMFIHLGPYSNLAGEWKGQTIPVGTEAEWIMQRFNIPVSEYREAAHRFNPMYFDATRWVELAKSTGMKYLVITAKHHDGFAMYHSQVSKYNIVDWTPFKRDPLKELSEACHKAGIRFCVYYSHREDWDDPNGYGNNWDYDRSKKNFEHYLETKSKPQLRELLTNYGPLGLVWFDRGMDTNDHARQFVELVHSLQPECLINGRVGGYGQDLLGDYQDMNDNGMPTGGLQEYWETPQTLNTTWGYSKYDQQWKTPGEVIRRMVEIVGKGGNYLLNIGPRGDGSIPDATAATLHAVGKWMAVNGESIYGTTASSLPDQPWGRTTVKGDKVYLHVFSWPADGQLHIPNLENAARSAYPLASPSQQLPVKREYGTEIVSISGVQRDENGTVVALQLDGPPKVAPVVLTQGSDTPFELDYSAAVTSGKAVKRFNRLGKFHIAKWTEPADTVQWHLLVSQTGKYNVSIRYAADRASAGDAYVITFAGRKIVARVAPTGEAYRYRTFHLGTIEIAKAASYVVELRPASARDHNLMFFQNLEFAPSGVQMVE